ncbi:MAG: hypothetical protein ACYCZR_02310 [Burkholderiales bacterium]
MKGNPGFFANLQAGQAVNAKRPPDFRDVIHHAAIIATKMSMGAREFVVICNLLFINGIICDQKISDSVKNLSCKCVGKDRIALSTNLSTENVDCKN